MDRPPPIDLPDDFGTYERRADARVVTWAAVILVAVVAIAAMVLFGAFA